MRKTRLFYVLFAVFVITAMVLSACAKATPAPQTTEPETKEEPTQPPAPALGTADNPVIWVLTPSQDTQKVLAGAEPDSVKFFL